MINWYLKAREGSGKERIHYPLFASADAGTYPHFAPQYHALFSASRGIVVLCADIPCLPINKQGVTNCIYVLHNCVSQYDTIQTKTSLQQPATNLERRSGLEITKVFHILNFKPKIILYLAFKGELQAAGLLWSLWMKLSMRCRVYTAPLYKTLRSLSCLYYWYHIWPVGSLVHLNNLSQGHHDGDIKDYNIKGVWLVMHYIPLNIHTVFVC